MALRIFAAVLIAGLIAGLIEMSGLALAQEPPKAPAAAEAKEPPKEPAKPAAEPERVLSVEKSTKLPGCVIKPVMSDDELRACGARIAK